MRNTILSALIAAALVGSASAAPGVPDTSNSPPVTEMGQVAATGSLVDVAKSAGMFNTLLKAATEAGLVETLSGKGPFTLFAPTDEAFAKVPKATLDALLKDKAKLKEVLLYHVVPGKFDAAAVGKSKALGSVEGDKLTVSTKGGKVMIDNATVIKANVKADNGVIHVIDTVLMPK